MPAAEFPLALCIYLVATTCTEALLLVQSKYEKTHHKLQQKKRPPSYRKFCVDFKNEKFTKINRVEPFQISHFILGPWEKILKNIAIYIFFTIMKNISLFTTNMGSNYFHTQYKIMWMSGWLITKLFEGLHREICKLKEKIIFHFILLHDSVFPIILSIFNRYDWLMAWTVSLELMHVMNSRKHIYETYFLTYIHYCYPIPPKFQSYIESHKWHLLIEKFLQNV